MFRGLYTALVTPFNEDYSLDIKAFQDLVDWQIQEGVDGLIVIGATGESPTITFEERDTLVKACLKVANKRVPVIVGTGSNATATAIKYTQHAKELGADAALLATPYYNKPSQEGIYQHYKAVNDNVEIPIFVYNIPGRSVVSIAEDTVIRLSHLKNVVGLKDCSGTTRPLYISSKLEGREFLMFTGDDPDAVAFNAHGGIGCMSVVSNVTPSLCAKIQKLMQQNNFKDAFIEHRKLIQLILSMFCESNPVPVKYAVSKLGKCKNILRLPLVPLQTSNEVIVDKALAGVGL